MEPSLEPYNPLAKVNLGRSVVDAMLSQPERLLAEVGDFKGAGIYAIYYRGNFSSYHKIAKVNRDKWLLPIYVGKAVPKGRRKGGTSSEGLNSTALSQRLSQHARSIELAENLDLSDFAFRSLAVDDIWIPLGESLVI